MEYTYLAFDGNTDGKWAFPACCLEPYLFFSIERHIPDMIPMVIRYVLNLVFETQFMCY